MQFTKASRLLTNPTIALTGPTGSGKTFSALKLASGISKAMGKPIALIDTENGSASLYSDYFDFETLKITPPFTTEKYIAAINLAEKGGFCALIVDSITHAWAGEGGLLEQKAQLDARPGTNHWTNWNPIKKKDLEFKSAYLHSNIPFLIATMRSKMEYAQSEDNGKKKIQKMGMAPVQSDGIEYEFSIVLDIAMNHEAEVSKDRTHLFDKNPIFKITEEVGEMLVKWRSEGKSAPARQPSPFPDYENGEQDYANTEPPDYVPDELDKFLGHPAGSIEAAGSYVISFGPYKDRKIAEMDATVLKKYCEAVEHMAKLKGEVIRPDGPVGQLFANTRIYLGLD